MIFLPTVTTIIERSPNTEGGGNDSDLERFKQGVPNKSDSIFGKFWGVFLSFFHVFKKLCKAIYEGHYFFRKWKSTKKTFQIPLLAFDFSELFFCDSVKKNSKNCLCVLAELFLFFDDLLLISPWLCGFCFFYQKKSKTMKVPLITLSISAVFLVSMGCTQIKSHCQQAVWKDFPSQQL